MGNLPDFSNTEKAFAWKSDAELKRALRLFQLFQWSPAVKYGPTLAEWSLKLKLPVKGLIRNLVFDHFCGGENMHECDAAAQKLHHYGVNSILDYSVEGMETEAVFETNAEEIKAAIRKAADQNHYPFSVFKTTGIMRFGLLEKLQSGQPLNAKEEGELQSANARFEALCAEAARLNVRLFVDAEESWIQEPIDRLTEEMMLKFNREKAIVFNTLQMYRHDRLAYLKNQIVEAEKNGIYLGFKLVRGAYMEKERARAAEMGYEDPIQPDKASSDQDYDAALGLCFEHRERVSVCAGTHNEKSSTLLAKLMQENGVQSSDERFWFAQLYGMSDHISFNLASEGFNVAKYLPYGPVQAVMPYLARRAQENTSVAGQMGRELRLIQEEWNRRTMNKS